MSSLRADTPRLAWIIEPTRPIQAITVVTNLFVVALGVSLLGVGSVPRALSLAAGVVAIAIGVHRLTATLNQRAVASGTNVVVRHGRRTRTISRSDIAAVERARFSDGRYYGAPFLQLVLTSGERVRLGASGARVYADATFAHQRTIEAWLRGTRRTGDPASLDARVG